MRRVRTKQPVALIFVGVRTEVASASWTLAMALPVAWAPRSKESGRSRIHGAARRPARLRIRTSRSFVPTATLSKPQDEEILINIYTIVQLVNTLFNFYSTLIVVYCFMTWIPMKQGGLLQDIAAVLDSVCGPWLNLFRRFIPPMGGVDFSPVVAIIALQLVQRLILQLL